VGIIGAANGLLSSYALMLMLIAFLQHTSPPVLPCLQEKFNVESQKRQTVHYPVSYYDLLSKKQKKRMNMKTPKYVLMNTDVFFEKD